MINLDKLIKRLEVFQENIPEHLMDIVKENEEGIVSYVTEIQHYMEGVRGSDGAIIMDYRPYAASTIALKIEKGQPTDRVTFRDTKRMHKETHLVYGEDEFMITSPVEYLPSLLMKYGEGIMALSDEHLHSLKMAIIRPAMIEKLKDAIHE